MQELTTSASLVEYETLGGGSSITAVLARSELEAALNADDAAGVWFELGDDDVDARLTIELADADIERILGSSDGDDVILALDGDAIAGLFDEPEVESHGLRGALAIAVTSAAIAAPAGIAATPQTADAASTAQRAQAAASLQQVEAAATTQVSSLGSTAQISKAQITKAQLSRSLRLKAAGVTLLHSGRLR